jgi:hypothetical protein
MGQELQIVFLVLCSTFVVFWVIACGLTELKRVPSDVPLTDTSPSLPMSLPWKPEKELTATKTDSTDVTDC